jgi:hypothetical protein
LIQEARKTSFDLTLPVIPFGLVDAIETTVERRWSFSIGTWIMIGGGLLIGMMLGGAGWIVSTTRGRRELDGQEEVF